MRGTASFVVMLVLLTQISGCYSTREVAVPSTQPPSPYIEDPIVGVTTASGETVEFDEEGVVRFRGRELWSLRERSPSDAEVATIYGVVDGDQYQIKLSDVQSVLLKQRTFNKWLTVVGIAVPTALIVALLAAVVGSQ